MIGKAVREGETGADLGASQADDRSRQSYRVPGGLSIRDRLYGWRDKLVSSPRFQRWAAAFPLTRGIAARQSRSLFDLCAGFVYSQILAACVELDLFRILAKGPRTAESLAALLSLSVEATERLLKGATALGLCETRGLSQDKAGDSGAMRYGLGMSGAALLGNPGVTGMIRHHALLYKDLASPVALLRNRTDGEGAPSTALAQFWPYATESGPAGASAVTSYSALMSLSQTLVVDDILEAYPFHQHRTVMDIGGGEGTFLLSLARHTPDPKLVLFDLPAVAERAKARFAEAGMAHRATAAGGDAAHGPLPEGADLVTLIRVLHDHDDSKALAILRTIHAALPPGGTLLLAEPMAGVKGAEPMGDAYFGFYLWAMGSGRPRTPQEIVRFLEQTGFEQVRILKTRRPLMTGAISARKPGSAQSTSK
jgi:demethylspheroidene O-methyltransferase